MSMRHVTLRMPWHSSDLMGQWSSILEAEDMAFQSLHATHKMNLVSYSINSPMQRPDLCQYARTCSRCIMGGFHSCCKPDLASTVQQLEESAWLLFEIKYFRPYLYGRQFTLQTDHEALRWIWQQRISLVDSQGGLSSFKNMILRLNAVLVLVMAMMVPSAGYLVPCQHSLSKKKSMVYAMCMPMSCLSCPIRKDALLAWCQAHQLCNLHQGSRNQ